MLEAAIEAWRRIAAENVSPVLPLKHDIMFQMVNSFTELSSNKNHPKLPMTQKQKGPAISTGIHNLRIHA